MIPIETPTYASAMWVYSMFILCVFFPSPFLPPPHPPSGPPGLFLASSVALGGKASYKWANKLLRIAGHRELSDKLFRAPTFPSSRQRRGSGARNDGLCQQLLFSLLGKSQETLMHAKAEVPAFFIF